MSLQGIIFIDIKFQMFIAFAYTYHYLNWFTKTTVIGWHRSLTGYRVLMILVIWISSVVLYYIDYGTGLIWLISLSILHVFLEFPLNLLSIKWLFSRLVIGD